MKKLIFFILSLGFASCDPVHDIDFIIINHCGQKIIIETMHPFGTSTNRNILADGHQLIMYHDFGLGSSDDQFLDRLDTIEMFQQINISLEDGSVYSKNALSISNWSKIHDDENARVTLEVLKKDFK